MAAMLWPLLVLCGGPQSCGNPLGTKSITHVQWSRTKSGTRILAESGIKPDSKSLSHSPQIKTKDPQEWCKHHRRNAGEQKMMSAARRPKSMDIPNEGRKTATRALKLNGVDVDSSWANPAIVDRIFPWLPRLCVGPFLPSQVVVTSKTFKYQSAAKPKPNCKPAATTEVTVMPAGAPETPSRGQFVDKRAPTANRLGGT
ncbi:hypothetical protein B0H17DRAFT_1149020 [Mycena rosella]|uniref:Uncharacterized protein n=1 Tax=Mycena rosella TaxID=1033263 RepID=A0AAD7FUU7_MYCRO|nr:hypothetical protein B0H17DRAFT_1149020 [Mycena rosella]